MGAAAGLPAGQPIVGGVLGAIGGFAIGFVGGAIASGGATYVGYKLLPKECLNGNPKLNAAFVCLDKFCNDRVPADNIGLNSGRQYNVNFYFYGGL